MSKIAIKIIMVTSFLSFSSTALCYSKDVAALKSMDISPYKEAVKGFKEIVDAKISEYTVGERENLIALISRSQKVDLVFTLGTDALRMAKDELKDVPVVYSFVLSPDASGRANITGINMNIPPEEQFRALIQVAPSVNRIGVVYDPALNQAAIQEAEAAAARLGITLVSRKVKTGAEVVNAITLMEGKIDALWMLPDTTTITPESVQFMLLFSFRARVPLLGISEKYVKSGALMALTFDNEDVGKQAGEMAMKILMGEDAASIPVPRPRKLRLSINLNTADKLGLKVSERVIGKAAKVYK